METILFSLAQAQFKSSAYTLEAYDNLGCKTMPCCPQYTFSFTHFSRLLFSPFREWSASKNFSFHKDKFLGTVSITTVCDWARCPWDPFQSYRSSPVEYLSCRSEGCSGYSQCPDAVQGAHSNTVGNTFLFASTQYKPSQQPVAQHSCLTTAWICQKLWSLCTRGHVPNAARKTKYLSRAAHMEITS